MKLSVIIPAYHCKNYIRECIASVLCQLPEDCEMIIVDDGSEDGTVNILRSYEMKQSNLRIVYRDHKGASAARNAGLDLAKGDYVSFLDCDDRMCTGFLLKSLPLLSDNALLYIFGFERIFLDGAHTLNVLQDRTFQNVTEFADAYIRSGAMLIYSVCNKFYRRRIIEDHHLRFEEGRHYGEDRLFNYGYLNALDTEEQEGIVTSCFLMYEYIERSKESMSKTAFPSYEEYMHLQEEKIRCFCSLSKNSSEEKEAFRQINRTAVKRRFLKRLLILRNGLKQCDKENACQERRRL